MIYRKVSELDFSLSELPETAAPQRVLLTSPTHFQVEYVINPHMAGNVGDVDPETAWTQWSALKNAYERIGISTHVVDGREGLPDMVFCANQTLPVPAVNGAGTRVALSRMYSDHRAPEVTTFQEFFSDEGYETLSPAGDGYFEGMGDAIWHPGRYLLWGGFGFRTTPDVYVRLTAELNVPIIVLNLGDPDFYHLDTCLSVLTEKAALVYPGAFDDDGLALIRALFEEVIEAPENESRELFACNAHCPDGHHVIIQRGCVVTSARLKAAGFEPIEVNTDEFLKAGGSVFCMKQMFW